MIEMLLSPCNGLVVTFSSFNYLEINTLTALMCMSYRLNVVNGMREYHSRLFPV